MKNMSVNFNTKSIFLDDNWYTINDISEKIKYNLNKGNYKIHHLSLALETLEATLNDAKSVNFIIDSKTFNKYQDLANQRGRSVEDFFRNALYQYINALETKIDKTKDPIYKKKTEMKEVKVIKEIEEIKAKPEVVKAKPEIIEIIKTKSAKPEIIKKDESQKNKPDVISKVVQDKKVKIQPSIIIEADNSEDDWFKR
jgi:hypothetical protein